MVLTEAAKSAFEALKVAVTEAPCLILASWNKPFEVWRDASNRANGAVLQQHGHLVAFLSSDQCSQALEAFCVWT